ncbi:MAG: M28 family peptidase [Bdellovibrionaceae bacterium]|nr:M28 family peptidase [Pseudobdellovibrionaceae bacterium]
MDFPKTASWRFFPRALTLGAVLLSVTGAARSGQPGPERARPALLQQHVEFLAALQPARRFGQVESLNRAAAYIQARLTEMGLPSTEQAYQVEGETYQNIRVLLGPAQGKRLVIGAHYDVCEDQPGADDNASGVAGLLELARLLAPVQKNLPRPVELVFYTLEEPPQFDTENMGSHVHAQSLLAENIPVQMMLSVEMIGYFSDAPDSQHYPLNALRWFYPTVGNFIGFVARPSEGFLVHRLKRVFAARTDLPTQAIGAPRLLEGVDWSDHRNYWDAGYTAAMVTDTSFARNPHYHKVSDRPETLDYRRMAQTVDGLFGVAQELQ